MENFGDQAPDKCYGTSSVLYARNGADGQCDIMEPEREEIVMNQISYLDFLKELVDQVYLRMLQNGMKCSRSNLTESLGDVYEDLKATQQAKFAIIQCPMCLNVVVRCSDGQLFFSTKFRLMDDGADLETYPVSFADGGDCSTDLQGELDVEPEPELPPYDPNVDVTY